jgi:glucose-1-phosphate cytidylyltransferase
LEIENGQITAFKEKLDVGQGAINGGYFVLNREVFDYLDDREDLTFEQEPLRNLAADGQLMAFQHEGFWLPMDTFREWNMLEKMWASGKAPWKVW